MKNTQNVIVGNPASKRIFVISVLSLLWMTPAFETGCNKQDPQTTKKSQSADTSRTDTADPSKAKIDKPGHGKKHRATKAKKTHTLQNKKNPSWRHQATWSNYGLGDVSFRAALPASKSPAGWVVALKRKVLIFAFENGQQIGEYKLDDSPKSSVLSPDGRTLAMGHSKGPVKLLNLQTKKNTVLTKHPDSVQDLSFDPKGKHLASVSQDGTLKVSDVTTKKVLYTAESPEKNGFYSAAFSPDGRRIVVGGYKQIHLFDLKQKKFTQSTAGPGKAIRAVSFRPDGKRLAAASSSAAQLLDTTTWKPTETLAGYRSPVAYGPKGKWLALSTPKKQLAFRHVATQKIAATLQCSAAPWRLAFAPDGRTLATVQRMNSELHIYKLDRRPEVGFWITGLRWYDDNGPALYVTLQATGRIPANTVGFGLPKDLKAVDDQGRSVKSISASPKFMQWMDFRNRHYTGTKDYGFNFTLRLHSIPPKAKRIKHLTGSFVMRVATRSKTLIFDDPANLLKGGKPLAHPTLKKMGLSITLRRNPKDKTKIQITQKGILGQLEAVYFLDDKGNKKRVVMSRSGGALPTWSSSVSPEKMNGWKLQLHVNPGLQLFRSRFDVTDISIPPRKKP